MSVNRKEVNYTVYVRLRLGNKNAVKILANLREGQRDKNQCNFNFFSLLLTLSTPKY